MKTTVDKAGRIVIPLAIRKKAMLEPGTEVEIEVDDRGVRLTRAVPGPELVRENGRLIARPRGSPCAGGIGSARSSSAPRRASPSAT